MLTDKARIDFEKWLIIDKREEIESLLKIKLGYSITESFYNLPLIVQRAYIIEWFESVGFLFDKCSVDMSYKIWTEDNWEKEPIIVDCTYIEKRKNWAKEAIQKANELYNTTHP